MNKYFLTLALAGGFGLGYVLHAALGPAPALPPAATGIGGVFIKSKQPAKLKKWYEEALGMPMNEYGCVFQWYQGADSTRKGFTQWSVFRSTTKYFGDSTQQCMINYRVRDLKSLVERFRKMGVVFIDSVQHYDYGDFLHIEDIDGNRIELWQPDDVVYEKMGGNTAK